jgi:protein-S-isoprenylcysteine O-methyltransferase Ste14
MLVQLGSSLASKEHNVVVLVRSVFWALVAPGTVLAWGLWLIVRATMARFDLGAARWAGVPLIVLGAVGLISCVWNFGKSGRGTLSPTDAPQFVVRGGLYRYVRNPMYVSVLAVLTGEIVLLRSVWLIAWTAVFATWFVCVTVFYEEPRLRRRFGEPYLRYIAEVPRWLPRRPTTTG